MEESHLPTWNTHLEMSHERHNILLFEPLKTCALFVTAAGIALMGVVVILFENSIFS